VIAEVHQLSTRIAIYAFPNIIKEAGKAQHLLKVEKRF